MVTIMELMSVVLESMLELLSPEKTASKIKDTDIKRSTKWRLIAIFILIYSAALAGILFSLFFISDLMYRVISSMLIMFLLYCIFIFYKKLSISK